MISHAHMLTPLRWVVEGVFMAQRHPLRFHTPCNPPVDQFDFGARPHAPLFAADDANGICSRHSGADIYWSPFNGISKSSKRYARSDAVRDRSTAS